MEKVKDFAPIQQNQIKAYYSQVFGRKWLFPVILLANDYLAIVSALFSAYYIRAFTLSTSRTILFVPHSFIYVIIPIAFLFFLHYDKLYSQCLPFSQQTEKIFKVSTYAMLLVLVLMYVSGSVGQISRIFMFLSWIFTFLYLSLSRTVIQNIFRKCDFLQIPVVVFGAGKTLDLLLTAFKNKQNFGYKIVGIIEDELPVGTFYQNYPILGAFEQAEDIIKTAGVRDVLIAAPGLSREALTTLIYTIQPLIENVTFVPDLFGIPVSGMEVETLFDEKVVLLKVSNHLSKWYNLLLKRSLDLCVSLCLLPLALVIMIFIAVAIYFDSQGPVVYPASRIGCKGKVFCCYKFRTMYVNHQEVFERFLREDPAAEQEWKVYAKIKGEDPRVTRVGQFLRNYSLDELPQIVNVLLGDMSLVGPRPYLPRERHWMKYYRQVIQYTKPGITGLWQVSGRNQLSFEERLQLDAWYVRNWSVWLDMMMLLKTVGVVLKRKGAY